MSEEQNRRVADNITFCDAFIPPSDVRSKCVLEKSVLGKALQGFLLYW